jgi:UTP--glucose-1-phosphate uridylyltransferase
MKTRARQGTGSRPGLLFISVEPNHRRLPVSDVAIKTVIIPAAGLGSRLLPATRVTAKELLPVYDRVVLDFAIDEAVDLGAERIVVVISTAKIAIQAYLADRSEGIAARLGEGKRMGQEIIYIFQDSPLGLGHAVHCCKDVMLPGPFAVLLPDDIVLGANCLAEMASHYRGGHMIAAMQVKPEETSQYGIFRLGGLPKDNCLPVSGMVEKPGIGTAPSSFAAVGRYILDPMIFDVLERTPTGRGGEVQLTDAITLSGQAVPVTAFRFSGTRHDCGNHDGLLAASIARKAEARAEKAIAGPETAHSATPAAAAHAIVAV